MPTLASSLSVTVPALILWAGVALAVGATLRAALAAGRRELPATRVASRAQRPMRRRR